MDEKLLLAIRQQFPKLYFITTINNKRVFRRENPIGHVEYKRTLTNSDDYRLQKYATQMLWRATENKQKRGAVYYIGVDDDGRINGLTVSEIFESIEKLLLICDMVMASIAHIIFILVDGKIIIRCNVRLRVVVNYLDVL